MVGKVEREMDEGASELQMNKKKKMEHDLGFSPIDWVHNQLQNEEAQLLFNMLIITIDEKKLHTYTSFIWP